MGLSPAAAEAPVEEPLVVAFLGDPNSVHTRRWMTFFAERGHAVTLLVDEGVAIDLGLSPAINLKRVPLTRRHRLPGIAAIRARRVLRSALAELGPDIVHAHFLTRYGWLARVAGIHPFVMTLWGSDILVAPRRSWRLRLKARATLRAADLVTYASEHIRDEALALGAHRDRVRFIHHGVDTSRFRPGQARTDAFRHLGLAGRRVVFSPRSLTPLYRHETVLRAAAGLPKDVVVLVGARRADREHLEFLRALALDLGLGDRFVVAPDFPDDLTPPLFASADVVVSVPESDGLPLTILEAMAAGVPVIATDLPGPRSCLADHPDLLVPVGDASALGDALRRVLSLDPDARKALGTSLRAIVVERFEYRDNMLHMEDEYRALRKRGAVAERSTLRPDPDQESASPASQESKPHG